MSTIRILALAAAVAAFGACRSERSASAGGAASADARPVVVQGAMDIEVRTLVAALEQAVEEHDQGWTFWRGSIGGSPVVVSKTLKGTANASAATALAIERYHPLAIVNQGTAGGHDPALHVSDIVLGTTAVNIGAFKTGLRSPGSGSDIREWRPLDLLQSDGSAGQDPNAWQMRRFPGDPDLLAAAERVKDRYRTGRVVDGVIGSSDMWNSELDRIRRFHDEFGTSAEEMETAPAAQVAGLSHVPFLGIRVLSNNLTNGGAYDGRTAEECQAFVVEVVREYVREKRRKP
jgi:adenosylhomocysteine nucleosidase